MADNFLETPLGSVLLKYRRLLVVSSQIFLFLASYSFAFALRYDFILSGPVLRLMLYTLPVMLFIKIVVFLYFDLYRGWWRYVSMEDLKDIIKAASVSTLFFTGFIFLLRLTGFPRSVLVIDWIVTIGAIGGIRFLIRAIKESSGIRNPANTRDVLIVGAKEIGVAICKEMKSKPSLQLNPIGFIDDFLPKKGFKIHGVPILGGRADLPKILEVRAVDEIIIAVPSLSGKDLREFMTQLRTYNVKLKIVPPMSDLLEERVSVKNLREVYLEDLLGRESVKLDTDQIRSCIKGKTVVITGAGGSIGSELSRQVSAHGPEALILYERNESDLYYIQLELTGRFPSLKIITEIGDILDQAHLMRVFEAHRPSICFHAAAYKHVPMMEEHPVEAIRNNIVGTRNVVETALQTGVDRFVLISSDKAVQPMNVMGMTKRVTELLVLDYNGGPTKLMAVRFGNVLGSNGSVIPLFSKQIAEGGPVTVTHPEAMRFFMTIPEAVGLVMQTAAMGEGGETFVLEMGKQIKVLDLALNMIRLSGLEPEKDIEIRFTGLRKGEKLREELFSEEEGILPTSHEKIKIIKANGRLNREFHPEIKALEELARAGDREGAVRKLTELCRSGSGAPASDADKQSR